MSNSQRVVHLTSSRFFGAPERQMLGLAEAWRSFYETTFISFSEGGLCNSFLTKVRDAGFEGRAISRDTPNLPGALSELAARLAEINPDVVIGHSYKGNILGLLACRRHAIPFVAVSHGWTAESWRVRLYEMCERRALRHVNKVVCVSHGQARKVITSGVRPKDVTVIWDAVDSSRFAKRDSAYRDKLRSLFTWQPRTIVGAAGRLSPEKGFAILISAARQLLTSHPDVAFVLFGEGKLREQLAAQIEAANLSRHFVLAGFTSDLDRYLPWFDILALSSYTEGLPNIVLEACAAGVPVVATSVGGIPEIIDDGVNGRLVPSGDANALATALSEMVLDDQTRQQMAIRAQSDTVRKFTFAAQAAQYRDLLAGLGVKARLEEATVL